MNSVQEIVILTKKGVHLDFRIYPDGAGETFSAAVLHREPGYTVENTAVMAVAVKVKGAEGIFSECVRYVVNLCEKREDTVVSINNPCNCEFVSMELQQKVVNRRFPTIQVTVNA